MENIYLSIIFINTVLLFILFFRRDKVKVSELKTSLESMHQNLDRTERLVREEISRNREELMNNLSLFSDSLNKQLTNLTQTNEEKLEKMRDIVEQRIRDLQQDNSQKLEKMRETVDEKLHSTLEKRLNESFNTVSDRLEKVHQGLGEMQSLAQGVGDLKKVMSNVKTRGTWGEIQLENLLEQILTPDQYDKNVVTKKGSRDPVEFAIKYPGRDNNMIYLPIDAKYPTEDYEKLLKAQDENNIELVEESAKAIEQRIKFEAKKIKDKYIDPPNTTDFGILFLPAEGLYAEVLRRPGFSDALQRDFRVCIAGPTTIAALLNSLQLGFRTIAVEKRASEVWNLLGTVKKEFGTFGTLLEKTHQKIESAGKSIETAARKSRTIERKLNKVQEIPAKGKAELIDEPEINVYQEPIDDGTVLQ